MIGEGSIVRIKATGETGEVTDIARLSNGVVEVVVMTPDGARICDIVEVEVFGRREH